jgi:hypothetical protein
MKTLNTIDSSLDKTYNTGDLNQYDEIIDFNENIDHTGDE